MDLYDCNALGARKCCLLLYRMDGRCSTLTRSESDSFAYIGIFLPTLDRSWMSDCCPFPISKWRNLTRLKLCSGTSSLAHHKIGTTDWKGQWSCPTPHCKTPCACISQWSAWCVGRCCITWLGRIVQLWSCQFPFGPEVITIGPIHI